MCEVCGGAGSLWRACATCKGAGVVETPQQISATIPRGIINNCPLQVNSPFGPVVISVVVQYPDNVKQGTNGRLIKDVAIPYHVAVIGGTATVELIEEGTITVKFPPHQNGQLIKIKGKGLYPGPNIAERGDLFLKPYVDVPRLEELTEEHQTIIRQLAKLYTTDTEEQNL
jgi:DnaJ-class molecular chaperone